MGTDGRNDIRTDVQTTSAKIVFYKTRVINDSLGQPTVPAGSDCRLILKFWDGRMDGHSV